ncbi:class A beta-lactamase-related serine hydrolase [Gordonia sp. OPL2]|nr:class A beta-lactamase-related serine hydrolase [Gordonia sp. OPL2]
MAVRFTLSVMIGKVWWPAALTALMVVGALAVSVCAPAVAAPASATQVRLYLLDKIARGEIPGALVEVAGPAGRWSTAEGFAADRPPRPMSTTLQHRIGSITKTFTTTLVLQLVREGKVALDDPIARYVDGVPGGSSITVRMLGDMTAGLSEYLGSPALRKALFANPYRNWTTNELLSASYALGPEFAPGASSSYSNANTVVLGRLVENVDRTPFAVSLRNRILRPYGLTNTYYPTTNRFRGAHTDGHTAWLPGSPITDSTDWNPSYGNAAGQMVSTIGDLTRWVRLLGTGALVGPRLQAERLRWKPIGDNTATWHYTFGIEENSGWLGHNGEIFGYETYAVYHPRLRSSIVLAVNTDKRIGTEPAVNVILRDISGMLFPGHRVEVPVVG